MRRETIPLSIVACVIAFGCGARVEPIDPTGDAAASGDAACPASRPEG